MKIFLIIVIVLLIIAYAFWLKLLKGKPGRIAGVDVEKKTFEEALVVDVRWQKEYARGHAINAVNLPIKLFKNGSDVLDDYKDKDIILYCVVDVTSRNTEKLLRERGFTKLHIGDGIKQYDYGKAIYSNALLSEFKYRISASKNKQLLNLGSEVLSDEEIKVSPEEIDSVLDRLDKSSEIFVYSDKPELSKAVCKKLGLDGYTIINLVEPFSTTSYRNAFYNKNDYIESQDEKEAATCSA
ncbi:rhodanese-like domain-containing protein [uncultured Gemella sp.]|uniref:rhodanese-like domain-containing protein n=1 Tax=uncultured Gemella sp. TaxID=254352 RepID=UPI0028EA78E8|nr:rhodanese-like domain-containing protein [uncultured Gemella sp.]